MMKYLRFLKNKEIMTGTLQGEKIQSSRGKHYSLHEVTLLPPCEPTKIICAGLNYFQHAQEMGQDVPKKPIIFLKPTTALTGPLEPILYPPMVKELHYEAELAVVIQEKCQQLTEGEVPGKILGYTCFNDVTARDLQREDGQWTRSKSFNTFAPTGPFIVPSLDPQNLQISLALNGETRQSSSTKDMIFPVNTLVSFISHIMTLLPGDIIATGTPSGVGPMKVGDVVEVTIEGIGTLKNHILSA